MKKRILTPIISLLLLTLIAAACQFPIASLADAGLVETDETQEETKTSIPEPTSTPTPEKTQEKTDTPTEPAGDAEEGEGEGSETEEEPFTVGPEDFPEGINPLTGLPADQSYLDLPPALISISNYPASARPQAGLNSSPIVFELYIGEGMTRFLAMFYGKYPTFVSGQTEGGASGSEAGSSGGSTGLAPSSDTGTADSGKTDGDTTGETQLAGGDIGIGPIRSGRLPYEDIRSIYSGFLVMASAYSGVAQTLSQATTIYGSDSDDINSALIDVNQLYNIAQSHAEGYPGSNFNLEGMMFSTTPAEDGKKADKVWIFYSSLNQIQWQYDEELGAYIRYDIKTDGSGEFVMATDQLTGEPVSRENVIVIFAMHDFIAPTLIDIQLTNMPPMPALLFRDGELHEIFWTTQFGEYEQETGLLRPMRFVDAEGNPVPLKPGQTWVEIVTTSSYYTESVISEFPFYPVKEEQGTGLWLVRFKGIY